MKHTRSYTLKERRKNSGPARGCLRVQGSKKNEEAEIYEILKACRCVLCGGVYVLNGKCVRVFSRGCVCPRTEAIIRNSSTQQRTLEWREIG